MWLCGPMMRKFACQICEIVLLLQNVGGGVGWCLRPGQRQCDWDRPLCLLKRATEKVNVICCRDWGHCTVCRDFLLVGSHSSNTALTGHNSEHLIMKDPVLPSQLGLSILPFFYSLGHAAGKYYSEYLKRDQGEHHSQRVSRPCGYAKKHARHRLFFFNLLIDSDRNRQTRLHWTKESKCVCPVTLEQNTPRKHNARGALEFPSRLSAYQPDFRKGCMQERITCRQQTPRPTAPKIIKWCFM